MTEGENKMPTDERHCEVCHSILKHDEKTLCSLCDVGADDLIPPIDDIISGKEKDEEEVEE